MKLLTTLLLLLPGVISGFTSTPTRPSFTSYTSSSKLQAADNVEVSFGDLDGTNIRIGIIKTRWNQEHVDNLVSGTKSALKSCNVTDENIFETEVPGAFELPYAAKLLAMSGTVDAIICTGVLIKGSTMHFEYICEAVSSGIMNVGLTTNTPVIFGVLTCLTEEQVVQRSTGSNNHGEGWAKTAIEMALLRKDAFGKGKKGLGSTLGFGDSTTLNTDGKQEKKSSPGFF